MKLDIGGFGPLLISRPAGRDAALVVRAYQRPATDTEPIELDFSRVQVIAPSWLDEFIQTLESEFGKRVVSLPSNIPVVVETLRALQPD